VGNSVLALPSDYLSDGPLIIPIIIQMILLYPSGAVWTDEASNVSRPDPSGAVQVDAEHPSRHRKVVGSNPAPAAAILSLITCREVQVSGLLVPLVGGGGCLGGR
jgi:hypothetical protein